MDTTLTSADGLPLHLREWAPAPGAAPHGNVLLVHGLGEHVGRYEHVAAWFNAQGWRVWAHDQRGHGRSGGERGRLAHDDALLRDLAQVVDHVRGQHPGRLLLAGHSMGGLIAALFVGEALAATPAPWSRAVDALLLSSPALAADTNAVQKLLLVSLGALAPNLAVSNGLKPQWISRDAAVVRAYVDDPLVHDRLTPRLARFILDGGERARALAPRWRVPTRLLWAGSDRCVAPRGSAEFAAAAPPAVVSAQVFPALFHEIFNEPERDEVFAAVRLWLAARSS